MQIVKVTPKSAEIERICGREVAPSKEIHDKVMQILADIKKGGIAKATEYAQKFDGLKGKNIRVPASAIAKSAAKCPKELQKALKQAIKNVRDFHKNQMEESWLMEGADGVVLGQRIRPMKRVGLYVPGGAGIYPSTLIMNAVPALVAGVQDSVVVKSTVLWHSCCRNSALKKSTTSVALKRLACLHTVPRMPRARRLWNASTRLLARVTCLPLSPRKKSSASWTSTWWQAPAKCS